MLRSFLRRWLGIDDDSLVFSQRLDGFYDLHEVGYKALEQRVSETCRQLDVYHAKLKETATSVRALEGDFIANEAPVKPKPKTKPKAKVKK